MPCSDQTFDFRRVQRIELAFVLRLLRLNPLSADIQLQQRRTAVVAGFVDMMAIKDWASRRVLARRAMISLESCLVVDALDEALANYGLP